MEDEFNEIMETLELELREEGVEYNHDGETAFVDNAWAMGALSMD